MRENVFFLGMLRFFYALTACLMLFAMLSSPLSAQALPADSVSVERREIEIPEGLPEVDWQVHRWTGSLGRITGRNLSNMAFRLFKDETLLSETELDSRLHEELEILQEAGFSAVLQRGGIEQLGEAVKGYDVQYSILNTFSPLRLRASGIEGPDCVVREIAADLDRDAGDQGLYRRNGKPVYFCFWPLTFEPDEWAYIIRQVREKAGDALFIFHAGPVGNILNRRDPADYLRGYVDVFDGVMNWGGTVEDNIKVMQMAREVVQELEDEKLFYFTVAPGYWRLEKGMYRPRSQTKDLRARIEYGLESGVEGFIVESWDDYSENHQVQPSLMNHTVMMDLLRWYISATGGSPFKAAGPGIYISHPYEVLRGETLNLELIALPTGEGLQREIVLELTDAGGEIIYESPPQLVPEEGAHVFDFGIPTAGHPGYIRAAVRCEGVRYVAPIYAEVREGWVKRPFDRHATLSLSLVPKHVSFTIAGSGPGEAVYVGGGSPAAELEIESPVDLERLDVVKNYRTFYSADWEKAAGYDLDDLVHLRLSWATPTRHEGESTNFGGRLSVEGAVIAAAICGELGRDLKISESEAAWEPRQLSSAVELALSPEGDSPPEVKVNFAAHDREIHFSTAELQNRPWLSYAISPHSRLRVEKAGPSLGLPDPLGKRTHSASFSIDVPDRLQTDRYHLRAIGSDGSVYRSLPVKVHASEPAVQRSAIAFIWDEAAGRRRPVELSSPLPVSRWSFDEEGRYGWDSGGRGLHAQLGGAHYRDGGYRAGAEPERVSVSDKKALSFDGGSYVHMGPGIVPHGPFEFSVRMRAERPGEGAQTIFYAPFSFELSLDEDGRPYVLYGRVYAGSGVLAESKEALEAGRWYDVSVMYDLDQLRLMIDGRQVATAHRRGYAERIVHHTAWLGAAIGAGHLAEPLRPFYGQVEEVTLKAGAEVN